MAAGIMTLGRTNPNRTLPPHLLTPHCVDGVCTVTNAPTFVCLSCATARHDLCAGRRQLVRGDFPLPVCNCTHASHQEGDS